MKFEIENPFASLRTARSAAAIGSIELCGPSAAELIGRIFRPNTSDFSLAEGHLHYGHFIENGEIIDDGIVGVEAPGRFALHSHGNPLILQRLLRLLEKEGATIIPLDEMLLMRYRAESASEIEAEAKAESLRAVSLAGMKLIRNQGTQGLAAAVQQWLNNPDLDTIRRQAAEILARSRVAARLLRPVKILLAGPPNSGKSTLLNRLAGREQALVSDTPGTTRDWVGAFGRIDPLYIEWIDTAGLDARLRQTDALDDAAQAAALEQLQSADLILYLLDAAAPAPQPIPPLPADVPVLTVLNKCDQPQADRPGALCISAQTGRRIDALAAAILDTLEVQTLAPTTPVAFTHRQIYYLEAAVKAEKIEELKIALDLLYNKSV